MAEIFPKNFIASLHDAPGFNEINFKDAHQQIAPVSVRINSLKSDHIVWPDGIAEAEIPWHPQGRFLSGRPAFTLMPQHHAGHFYVQEASSMFLKHLLENLVDVSKPLKVLDLCAAPGGKTTLLQNVLSRDSLIVANEVVKNRVGILSENTTRWGAANVVVVHNDASDFARLPGFFDVIVADAPCSGSGLFRKDADAASHWSTDAVKHCSRRQKNILQDALPALKEGGLLIYSTCSYSVAENEAVGEYLIQEHLMQGCSIHVPKAWNILESDILNGKGIGYRFYPDRVQGEGFYISAFIKTGDVAGLRAAKKQTKKVLETTNANETKILQSIIATNGEMDFFNFNEYKLCLLSPITQDIMLLLNTLYVKKAGVIAGQIMQQKLIPHHELAVAANISTVFPIISLPLVAATDYLRRKPLTAASTGTGWHIVVYENAKLGFVKILPGRINNYYPAGLRILHL